MRLNLDKCVFEVQGGKFLGFMFTHRGIKANLDKYEAIIKKKNPQSIKEVQRLIGRLASLSRFLPKATEKARPFFQLLKKPTSFYWNNDSSPPILTRLVDGQDLYLYLAIFKHSISTVVVQETRKTQSPVCYISKMLQGTKSQY
ncbi:Retrovirus-related Pol polyprotein from transposon 17.6, partial [Mucuna pruriens]